MKFWAWVKGIGWIKTAGAILFAILMVLAGAKVTRKTKRAEHAERLAENMLSDRSKSSIMKATKLQEKAAKDKQAAVVANDKMQANLEKISEIDPNIEALAHHFNSERVRKRSDGVT